MTQHEKGDGVDREPQVIEYVVRPDWTVVEIRGAWDDFARENDGWGLAVGDVVGRDLWDFISGPETRLLYDSLVARVGRTRKPIRFNFRCDAPTLRRHMRMDLVREGSENVRFISRVLREEPRPAQPLLSAEIPRADETLVMCSWCKRVRLDDDRWVEVEEYVEDSGLMERARLPRLSHGLCPRCGAEMDALIDSVA